MNALFLKIINMSISASWLILAVLIFRLLLKKAPKWINVFLWGIVAVRLLCPFSIESTLSLIPSAETFPDEIISGPNFDIQTGIAPVDYRINDYLGDHYFEGVSVPANNGSNVMTVLTIAWMIGILLLAAYTAVSYWRLCRRIDTAVLYRDNIFQSEHVSSPFVLGIIKPRIYLPFKMNEQALEHVVAHEQAHIRRKDHWWKPLGFLLLTIHWFNPLMWLAYVLLCQDIELACDEKVIKELDNEQRADYSQALVACSVNRRVITACPLAFGEVSVTERVKSVMNYKKPAFWMVAVSILACAIVAICFLTDPKQDSFDIKIVIPAGSQESVVYSDEEISPTKNQIIITAGDHLGDTEVILKPVEVKQENAYDEPAYLTPGLPVKMDAEKGGWFHVGVNLQNPTDEDMVVYVNVKNIEVRISAESPSDKSRTYDSDFSEIFKNSLGDETAIRTDYVYADDHAYDLDMIIQYADETGSPWKLAFVRDGIAHHVSQDWGTDYIMASALSYLGNGTVCAYVENAIDGTIYECTMTFSYDKKEKRANFKSASVEITDELEQYQTD